MVVKDEAIRFWLTHRYLPKIAKHQQQFFLELLDELDISRKETIVMENRYIDKLKFEAIAIDMNVDVRYVFRLHKNVIDKLIRI